MFSSAVIVFREMLEMSIIIGILAAATGGVKNRNYWIGLGIFIGASLSGIFGVLSLKFDQAYQNISQELVNGIILTCSVFLLTWTVVWMKQHSKQLLSSIKHKGLLAAEGRAPLYSIAIIAASAIFREGSEIFVFIYGLTLSSNLTTTDIISGGILGTIAGIGTGSLVYMGLLKFSPKILFNVTALLLILIAGGMAASAANYFVMAGLLPDNTGFIWDLTNILPINSGFGKFLQAAIGYQDKPSLLQFVIYIATIGTIYLLTIAFEETSKKV